MDTITALSAGSSRDLVIIRRWLLFFLLSLLVSGLTAFPIETLLGFAVHHWPGYAKQTALYNWMATVYQAVQSTNLQYPYLAYGTDSLAFAHILFTILFAGAVRGIPVYWRLLDTSFGIIGAIPLWIIRKKIQSAPHGSD